MAKKQIAAGSGIRVYRRHSEDCDKDAGYIKCGCPLWIQFQRSGKQIRESAKTRDLEQAMLLVKKVERELKGEIPVTTKISVEEAIQKWLTHREQDGIDNDRAKNMSRRLIAFCKERGITSLSAVTKTHLMDFKLTLDLKSGNSNSLRISLSVVGAFFRWATEEAGYLQANPFPKFKLRFTPQEVIPPTIEEVNRVLADESVRILASLMRFSGMAIRDASTLKRSALVGHLITSRRTKTDNPFRVRIPVWLADALRALPPRDAEYFFWDGTNLTVVDQHHRALRQAFKAAKVKMTSHGFRHYFISTTLATGVSVEDVSAMVGTSPNEIRKTYRHYIKEATDRLDDVQEQAWLKQGLDKDGNPQGYQQKQA
jgi:integrase